MAGVADKSRKYRSGLSDDKVTFVHCCCERGNILSRPPEGKYMKISDVTKEDDFTHANTVKGVTRQIRGPGDIFFILYTVHWWFDVAAIES